VDVRAKLAQLEGLAARGLVTAAERQAVLRELVKIMRVLLELEVQGHEGAAGSAMVQRRRAR
jgi:hypothetical protein